MRTPIGKLRHRVTLESKTLLEDGGGGGTASWETISHLWAAIEATSGKETLRADRISGRQSYIITIRHRDDITPAMRFRHEEQLFEITAIMDKNGRSHHLKCLCEQRDL